MRRGEYWEIPYVVEDLGEVLSSARHGHVWASVRRLITKQSKLGNVSAGPELSTRIVEAMQEIHVNTCLRFVPRILQQHYVRFVRGNECSSQLGMRTDEANTVGDTVTSYIYIL